MVGTVSRASTAVPRAAVSAALSEAHASFVIDMHRPFVYTHRPFIDEHRPFIDTHRPFIDVQRPFIDMHRPFVYIHRPFMNIHRPFMVGTVSLASTAAPHAAESAVSSAPHPSCVIDKHRPFVYTHRPFIDEHRPFIDIHPPSLDMHCPCMDIHRPFMFGTVSRASTAVPRAAVSAVSSAPHASLKMRSTLITPSCS